MAKESKPQRRLSMDELRAKYRDMRLDGRTPATDGSERAGGHTIERFVELAGKLAEDYRPSAYLRSPRNRPLT